MNDDFSSSWPKISMENLKWLLFCNPLIMIEIRAMLQKITIISITIISLSHLDAKHKFWIEKWRINVAKQNCALISIILHDIVLILCLNCVCKSNHCSNHKWMRLFQLNLKYYYFIVRCHQLGWIIVSNCRGFLIVTYTSLLKYNISLCHYKCKFSMIYLLLPLFSCKAPPNSLIFSRRMVQCLS